MMSPQKDVTPYLVVLVLIAVLGPLQFGYHLVSHNLCLLT